MKKVLMVAFHYPPFEGGSGVHRTLKFSRYLPDHGWRPVVLTASQRAYPRVGQSQTEEIPESVTVKRAFALDVTRHCALGGVYPRTLAIPDRWASWLVGAVLSGLRLIKREKPHVIWSTYPITTAVLIGLILHRLSGIPWVVDLRDSMTEEGYPRNRLVRRSYLWCERQAIRHASHVVFTTESTLRMYAQRYPTMRPGQGSVIPNGYDEEDIKRVEGTRAESTTACRPLRIVHAGLIYPEERDPRALFRALAILKTEKRVTADDVKIDLRGPGMESYYTSLVRELKIDDLVQVLPAIPFHASLRDSATADALLILQGKCCNHQIPAKLYEYVRLEKPILALTPADGDTGSVLRSTGGATIVDLNDVGALCVSLPSFLKAVRAGAHPIPEKSKTERFSRKHQAGTLAEILTRIAECDQHCSSKS